MEGSCSDARAGDRSTTPAHQLLIIGFGNDLRGDDGVGRRVAEAIEALHLPGIRVITCQQLTPDLADPIARADRVLFVDARPVPVPGEARVELIAIQAAPYTRVCMHAANPSQLIALTHALFGHAPPAACVAIPAESFDFGFDLSDTARQGIAEAFGMILRECSQR
jgi:hydrogenase maturation protease